MNKKNNHNEHQFAFYYPRTTPEIVDAAHTQKVYQLDDKMLCTRISSIVRLGQGESFILFDAMHHVECTIVTLDKKISISCSNAHKNIQHEPHITFLLPVLKREAFEEAIYSLTEIGVNIIQPILTAKMQRQLLFDKEKERISRIIWSAAEQSKNFAFPTINPPLPFNNISSLDQSNNCSLFFDPEGKPLIGQIDSFDKYEKFTLMIGPEGDLTTQEKDTLKQLGFTFCALTPTILRAQQAAALSAGILRSLVRENESV